MRKLLNFYFDKLIKKINNSIIDNKRTLDFITDKDNLDVLNVGVYKDNINRIRNHFPNSFHYLFEPNETIINDIQKIYKPYKSKLYNFALSNNNGEGYLKLNEAGSTLHNYSDFVGVKNQKFHNRKVKLHKLDDLHIPENKKYFMKIDSEGHELNILQGARKTLEHVNYILLETRLVPCYDNSYSIEDIFKEMTLNNFRFGLVASIGDPYKKIYRYLDILWVKKDLYDDFLLKILEKQKKM